MASKKKLEQVLNELENQMVFRCTDKQAHDCMGNCIDCDYYMISKKDFKEICDKLKDKYKKGETADA